MSRETSFKLFAGNSNRPLAEAIAKALDVPLARRAPDPDGNVVAISTELISGRRLLGGRSPGVGSDDAADGPVRATLRLRTTNTTVAADGAWVIVAPPKFAPR